MSRSGYGLGTATYLVVASMIGTGVFAALYFQAEALTSGFAVLALWATGGLAALAGGLCYAELSGRYPRSGGEYEYLTRLYHPALGFGAGVCTLAVGFAAPMAGSALNLGNYLAPLLGAAPDSPPARAVAALSVLLAILVQLPGLRSSGRFQDFSTLFKLGLILLLAALPFLPGAPRSEVSFAPDAEARAQIGSGGFFSSLALLYFAYTGWNASVYLSSEVERPQRTLPLSILTGIAIVSLLYLLLNYAFLRVCSIEEIRAGGSSVGNTYIYKLFGEAQLGGLRLSHLFSLLMSLALLATINAYMVAAPRVAEVMGKDYPLFRWLGHRSARGTPYVAVWAVGGLTLLFTLASDLRSLLDYVGFALSIFASLAVFGLYLRPPVPGGFRAWGYPLTPLLFIGINAAAVYYSIEILYGGNFLYAPGGGISPLAASVLSIALSVGAYFILPRSQRQA
jgi:APA family basic amino acid/polyamine antiporter